MAYAGDLTHVSIYTNRSQLRRMAVTFSVDLIDRGSDEGGIKKRNVLRRFTAVQLVVTSHSEGYAVM